MNSSFTIPKKPLSYGKKRFLEMTDMGLITVCVQAELKSSISDEIVSPGGSYAEFKFNSFNGPTFLDNCEDFLKISKRNLFDEDIGLKFQRPQFFLKTAKDLNSQFTYKPLDLIQQGTSLFKRRELLSKL